MRMRKKKHGAKRIEACAELLIRDIASLKDGFEGVFDADRPVHLEIGCGKGNFAVGMAKQHPDVNFIAMERVSDVCCIALEKAMADKDERPNDNLRFLIGDAKLLAENVKEHSLDCIYLNFSDPWPKAGHAKRRLTHRGFLDIYKKPPMRYNNKATWKSPCCLHGISPLIAECQSYDTNARLGPFPPCIFIVRTAPCSAQARRSADRLTAAFFILMILS